MTIFYHQSLPKLVEILLANGVVLHEVGVVRDGVGRLLVAAPDLENPNALINALGDLGPYASPLKVIVGEPARRLLATQSGEARSVRSGDEEHQVRYYDRRIVGSDWLVPPTRAPENGVPRLVFGSLKGGVGRSTAMAVLAADLAASGKRILVIDLDIEAPGIGFMLLPQGSDARADRRPQFGVIDYLVENGLSHPSAEDLIDFVGVSSFGQSSIDVIPAVGRATDDAPHLMMEKLSRALVEDNTIERKQVIDQVRELVDLFQARAEYDAVLIDARAGLGEISAAPLLGLAGEVLLFATDQPQTFRGYRYLLAHMRQHFSNAEMGDWREKLHFVQSKAPAASSKRAEFRERLYDLCAEFLYDAEHLNDAGEVASGGFSPAPAERGVGIPHDATYVEFNLNYDAFDPGEDETLLSDEVYRGPFDAFLDRAWSLLGFERARSIAHA